jgi:hypothetical protein
MAETKKLEVMVGKKADKKPEPDKIGKAVANEPKQEVGGRAEYWRWAQFSCGHVCRIYYDTSAYHAYECCHGDSIDFF